MASRLLSPRLRFAYEPGAFSLSYRASNEPQLLDIDLLATGKVFPFPPTIALSAWIEHANQGFGAGAEFAPARTRVEQVSGRRLNDAGDSMGPAYQFGLRVVCVSPFYLRNLVDRLSTPSATIDVAHLNIKGALAVDDSPLTVTTDRMKKWLKDRSAYVGRPLTLPFKLTEKAVKRGREVRVTFVEAPSAEHLGVQEVTQEGSVVTTKLTKFLYAPAPAIDALLGGLARFHLAVLPIASVDVHA